MGDEVLNQHQGGCKLERRELVEQCKEIADGLIREVCRTAYKQALRDHSIIRYSDKALETLAAKAYPDA